MGCYKNIREHILALEKNDKLVRFREPVNKDTELHPIVRLQFRGLPEEERKAWLFENVYDSKGKTYNMPVLIGALGASPQVYALGMQCQVSDIGEKWQKAMRHPIGPIMVKDAPAQQIVYVGDSLKRHGGLSMFPIPISTPGWDIAPYFTSPYFVTKDPESGIRNVGTYRAQVKSPTSTGIYMGKCFRGLAYHWRKARKQGKPLEAAIIIGAAPHIGYTSVSQLPTDVDEFSVAGGLAGEPVELVKCKTIDVEVPAHAEIVVEGEISTEFLEPEAPFGEATGYVGQSEYGLHFSAKCITHCRNPVWQAFISQFPPSESSVIRQIACANVLPKRLRDDLKMPFVRQVAVHFTNGTDRYVVLQLDKTDRSEVWRALEAMPKNFPAFSKIVVAVDEDIDPNNANLVNWAMTFRTLPDRDVRIMKSNSPDTMDFSIIPPDQHDIPLCLALYDIDQMPELSCLLIDATLKWPYPPVSLPPREIMERALEIWNKAGLPRLKLENPWYGYSLGRWSPEDELHARRAMEGDYYETGTMLARRRKRLEEEHGNHPKGNSQSLARNQDI